LLPLVTIVASYFFLDERLTFFSAAGAVLIIFGLWYSERVKQ
jgi:drug/metabolite transporter (DMT)-like permease